MKKWNQILWGSICVILLTAVCANVFLEYRRKQPESRFYQVEINRLMAEIKQGNYREYPAAEYEMIKRVERLCFDAPAEQTEQFFQASGAEYQVRYADGFLYRFDYAKDNGETYRMVQRMLNLILLCSLVGIVGVFIYVRRKILAPFHQIQNMPYELSKGNLVCDIKEEKNKYFGKFIWGISLLRDNIEEGRRREMQLQKEKRTLILSLSHDIKTPLSAIKLYAKALAQKLYDSEEKEQEIAECIDGKANEIENYLNQIIRASKEDFLHLTVEPGECYVKDLLDSLRTYYEEKLSLTGSSFLVHKYDDCLLAANPERSIEVLQNLVENAIKYGDGEKIEIEAEQEEDCCLITVINTGCSLPRTELSHIFESFWRGSNVGNQPGSGMGLYICENIMHQMLGEIYASIRDGNMRVTCVFRKA